MPGGILFRWLYSKEYITIVDSIFVYKVHVKYEAKQRETESSVIFLADFIHQKSVYTHKYNLPALYCMYSSTTKCISQNECDEFAFAYNFA